ncbi:hypothetical protein Pmar_PMAR021378 [Perkinsus marinus ATCC 50983]|uniref:Uncharacterized protein n=1 Tax=Perkinsus marinus (strain ATCC 50983 / TXsc) TaxID=423536 RepID=C5KX47_PERM5|nr:hypothetical protein Pmar_PMAR021378 [Perkinsus marinus ATCC 50983]EER10903.1 hypothetical protein Pmar_PMAR021378 [Perkinsus marinus ATCC 50983]|eukprot:XP_002779108.1 hypothetical protein Pmar_PMAR021378 [Perkinsus marinus ATCC 50983]
MASGKRKEVKALLDKLHRIYTAAQEDLTGGQKKLIDLLEAHTKVKDELAQERIRGGSRGSALIWVTGGDIGSDDKSSEKRIAVSDRIAQKAKATIRDNFFAKDGRLGIRVSRDDQDVVRQAARSLGYEAKVLNPIEP